jgi:hypothetical protein
VDEDVEGAAGDAFQEVLEEERVEVGVGVGAGDSDGRLGAQQVQALLVVVAVVKREFGAQSASRPP